MAACKWLGVMFVLIISSRGADAQTYVLAENNRSGDCFRVRLDMKLQGEMRITRNGRQVPLKLQAQSIHDFWERSLSVGKDGYPDKSCRSYDRARAVIDRERDHSDRTLRTERSLIVAQRSKDHLTVYSPSGPLTREELELTAEHFDTLAISGLLSDKPVAVGATWHVSNAVAQALCSFEGLTEQNLECKLEDVKNDMARVQLSGTGKGIELGAMIKVKLEAAIQFDLKTKRIVAVEWTQHDERDQGPASPASTIETKLNITRSAVDQPGSLSDVAIVSVPDGFEPSPALLQLEFHDAKGRFDYQAAREWETVVQGDEHTVLRLMDAGAFVAQATITGWTAAEKGKHLSPDEFRKAMDETPGWQMERELQASEMPTDGGRWIYRLSTQGQLDGDKVLQNFYLVAGPDGQQVVLAFTLPPKEADRVANRELSLVSSIVFPAGKPEASGAKQP
jgi:hypothetical protein